MSSPAFRWHRATALVGGAFDPPHLGHRDAVRGLFNNPSVTRVEILPTPAPVGKSTRTSPEHRLALARLGFASTLTSQMPPEVSIRLTEWERFQRQPNRPTYTYDTLLELRGEFTDPAVVIGTDQFLALPTWHRFPEVLGLSHWIILKRASTTERSFAETEVQRQLGEWCGSGLLRPTPTENEWETRTGTRLRLTPTVAPAWSSSLIRRHLELEGTPPEGALLPEVTAYLMKNRLYGTGTKLT